ncbi:kinase-like domain-containing protein [Rhizophagus diaphanus]|nr:kinase-like domain-containing protein [Rhizophagus diaphanus] [Rhizophagus sp. MUCL 43196]
MSASEFSYRICDKCKKERRILKGVKICHCCHITKSIFKSSGNKVIDNFIKQVNYATEYGKLEFVSYDQFKNIEFIAEGGFSKIYKAIWADGPINNWNMIRYGIYNIVRENNYTVVLKKLKGSNNITSMELNELKAYLCSNENVDIYNISKYFGITTDPFTKDIIIVMNYYNSGNLVHYLSNDFYNISWKTKLSNLKDIIYGLKYIHSVYILHRDFHGGNIFFNENKAYIGDLGINKSATESTKSTYSTVNYGIIPYMAPEIFQGHMYTKASDIYSFGMIMWEFMTGRRLFGDKRHDTELIIDIYNGLRPPIVTNAPEGYIELMEECWNSNPKKRPTTADIYERICMLLYNERKSYYINNPTEIIKSIDIGPVTKNNPFAIYKSRYLGYINLSTKSLRDKSFGISYNMICNECKKKSTAFYNMQICRTCFNIKTKLKASGNKAIDEFIRYTQFESYDGKMEFVPYNQFKDIEFIAEGGFSKVYKATWIDDPINNFHNYYTVVLKKLNNSKNVTSKELNEVKYT